MKALIRNNGETVLETAQIDGIEWTTGAPLTNPTWLGGPYTLVQNYVPEVENDLDFIRGMHEQLIEEDPEEETPQKVVEDDDYVIIGGVRYSKAELRSLIE